MILRGGIESPKTDDKLPVYMTLTDLKQLFDYLERAQSRFSMRNELMFKLLATTGLRRSELVSLIWE
ncbi:tyrosine-type recombinase/integrase [Lysinibacillus xylanilyticus]|uniref:tyrosine-type recombinase/integrase n=1 Tax=Lysinibacillus xylanilyticus TaxID=582475 RepID=UPI0037FBB1E4